MCALGDANVRSYEELKEWSIKNNEQFTTELIDLFNSYVEISDQLFPVKDVIQFMRKFCEYVAKNAGTLLSQNMDKLLNERCFLSA